MNIHKKNNSFIVPLNKEGFKPLFELHTYGPDFLMVYLNKSISPEVFKMNNRNNLVFQILQEKDIPEIVDTFNFPWTSLQATKEKWERYYVEQQRNVRTVCIAKIQEECVGYGSLLWVSEYPDFRDNNIPEINDVWISAEYRGNGYGMRLIQHLEIIAYQENHMEIGIGVGLYKDYGSAQKLYVQMGYIPNGKGVTYKGESVVPGDSYPLDDDLILWFKKAIS